MHAPCVGACTCCVAKRQIILSLITCLITANTSGDSKISHQYCPLTFYFRLDKETPTFDTGTFITTDLVNDEYVVTDGNAILPSWVLFGAYSRFLSESRVVHL